MPAEAHPDDAKEPMLQENASRFVIFPIKHHDCGSCSRRRRRRFWTAEEIDLAQRPQRLGRAQAGRAVLHQARPRLLRRVRRHRQREPRRAVLLRGAVPRGALLLRLPDHDRERAQRDLLAAHRHLRQGQGGEDAPLQRAGDGAVRAQEGRLGAALDRGLVALRRAPRGLCRRRGHLLSVAPSAPSSGSRSAGSCPGSPSPTS